MSATAANNLAATIARAAGDNPAAACTILSTITTPFPTRRLMSNNLRNVEIQTPKPDNRFKM